MAGARPDTWMPLYIGDYLRDTSRLTTEGHGAYLLLIFDYWVSGKPLPDDDQQLAAVARLSVPKWKALRPTMAQFFDVKDGLWRHRRIDKELTAATERIGKRSGAGKTGAEARWGNRNGKRNANGMANASDSQWQNGADANAPSQGASLPPGSLPNLNSESEAAREKLNGRGNPEVRRFATPAAAPKPPKVRENIKKQLCQKLMRYCNARLSAQERGAAILGLMGEDPDHDAQWWLDSLDKKRRREGWDDTREWKREHLGAAARDRPRRGNQSAT